MRKSAVAIVIILFFATMTMISADESEVLISSESPTVSIYPGQSGTLEFTISALGYEQNTDPTIPMNTSGTTPTTTTPTTTPSVPEPPLPPESNAMISNSSSISSLATGNASTSMYSMLNYPKLYMKYEAPEGITIEFSPEDAIVPLNTEEEIIATISVDDSLEEGTYQATITVRSNAGHSATLSIDIIVKPFIDIIVQNVTSSPNDAVEGDIVTFYATVSNDGKETTGPITCTITDKNTDDVLISRDFIIPAETTEIVDIEWVSIEGIYEYKAYVSSPPHEKVTYNNIAFNSLEVDACVDPTACAQAYLNQGNELFDSGEWELAQEKYILAKEEFELAGYFEEASNTASYVILTGKYIQAEEYFNSGLKAEDNADYILAEENFKAAETLYTELGYREGIDLCFSKIFNLSSKDIEATESSSMPFSLLYVVFPLIIIVATIGYSGYSNKKKSNGQITKFDAYQVLVNELRAQVSKGELSHEEFDRLCTRLKEKLSVVPDAQNS